MIVHKIGDKVRIIADYCCHNFKIGSIVTIEGYNPWHTNTIPSYDAQDRAFGWKECIAIESINPLIHIL